MAKHTTAALIGKRFGARVVVGYSHYDPPSRMTFWNARCECGRVDAVAATQLFRTKTCRACCVLKANAAVRTHGLSQTPEYEAWSHIRQRTSNPKCQEWDNYGGRGIRLCEGWQDSKQFLDEMGRRPSPKHSIDRKNNNGHYSCGKCGECAANGWPMNCRWATQTQQTNNTRNNLILEYGGYRLTAAEWQRRLRVPRGLIQSRSAVGWSTERVLTTPPDKAWSCVLCQTRNRRNETRCVQCRLIRPKLDPLASGKMPSDIQAQRQQERLERIARDYPRENGAAL